VSTVPWEVNVKTLQEVPEPSRESANREEILEDVDGFGVPPVLMEVGKSEERETHR